MNWHDYDYVIRQLKKSEFNAGIAIGTYGLITDSIGLIHTTWISQVMVLGCDPY